MENAKFIMTQTSTLLPLKIHHLANNSAGDILKPNINDLRNFDTFGIKKPNKLEENDSLRQAFKGSIIKKKMKV